MRFTSETALALAEIGCEWFSVPEDGIEQVASTEHILTLWSRHWTPADWMIVCDSITISQADYRQLVELARELRWFLNADPDARLRDLVARYKRGERSTRSPHLAVPSG